MFDLFYTLFKYKEKAQKDELGYYPEKVDVRAFPERRFLWTSRFFVVVSAISLCLNMILAGTLTILIPQQKVRVMPLQIDYNLYQVTTMQPYETVEYAGDLVTESLMAKYIILRYTIGEDFDELKTRLGENNFVYLASADEVYTEFAQNELPYFETLQKRNIRRQVKIKRIYPVSFDFWQVRFETIDIIPNQPEPLISRWIATLRMNFNSAKYEDKNLGLINPFGITINRFSLSYVGNNKKNMDKK
ncbi:MAG: type IV secretion system protein [Acetobacter sp.]|nr:type IV secretion system protein [Acetobacter sp.]